MKPKPYRMGGMGRDCQHCDTRGRCTYVCMPLVWNAPEPTQAKTARDYFLLKANDLRRQAALLDAHVAEFDKRIAQPTHEGGEP